MSPPSRSSRVVSDIAHPCIAGKRLRVSALSEAELAQAVSLVQSIRRDLRFGLITLDEAYTKIRRLKDPRSRPAALREAWNAHVASARATMRSKLRASWQHQLAPELGELDVADLTPRRLSAWDKRLEREGYAPKTVRDTFMELAAAVRASLEEHEELPWAVGRGKLWRPSRAPRPRRETPACCTIEEAERVIAAALEEDRAQRAGKWGLAMAQRLADMAPRVAVILFCAMRNGEGAGFGWDDVVELDGDAPRARVVHQALDQWRKYFPEWKRPLALPKGGKPRELALHPTAVMALRVQRELLDARGWFRADGPVFPGHEGNEWAGTWRNNANCIRPSDMKRLAANAGLPWPEQWVTHSLRHSLATLESVSGADLRSIQKRTGHSSLSALETYIHARTRGVVPSAVPQLEFNFDPEHDTDKDLRAIPPEDETP